MEDKKVLIELKKWLTKMVTIYRSETNNKKEAKIKLQSFLEIQSELTKLEKK